VKFPSTGIQKSTKFRRPGFYNTSTSSGKHTEIVLVLCPHFLGARHISLGQIFFDQPQCEQALTEHRTHDRSVNAPWKPFVSSLNKNHTSSYCIRTKLVKSCHYSVIYILPYSLSVTKSRNEFSIHVFTRVGSCFNRLAEPCQHYPNYMLSFIDHVPPPK